MTDKVTDIAETATTSLTLTPKHGFIAGVALTVTAVGVYAKVIRPRLNKKLADSGPVVVSPPKS